METVTDCGPSGRLPNFVIIGAMRAGTTYLADQLRHHPQVFMAPQKEIHFFDQYWDKGVDWYRTHFTGASGERIVAEATPRYMYFPDAAPRMAQLLPDASLLCVLRNPIDRAYSHYWRDRALGKQTLSFEQATEEELAGRKSYAYVDRGRYLEQILRWCNHYPRSSLRVLIFEDLRDRPVDTFGSVCRFLEIDDVFRPTSSGRTVNGYVTFRSLRVRAITHRLPPLPAAVLGRLNQRRSSYPPMEESIRKQLRDVFQSHNAELSAWLGRDLSNWNR